MNYTDKFGVIPYPITIDFKQSRIYPVESYEQVIEDIKAHACAPSEESGQIRADI
jgi:hypothetical protein